MHQTFEFLFFLGVDSRILDLTSSLFFNIRTEAWKLVSAGVDRRRDQVVAQ